MYEAAIINQSIANYFSVSYIAGPDKSAIGTKDKHGRYDGALGFLQRNVRFVIVL